VCTDALIWADALFMKAVFSSRTRRKPSKAFKLAQVVDVDFNAEEAVIIHSTYETTVQNTADNSSPSHAATIFADAVMNIKQWNVERTGHGLALKRH
jgi:hypothetical protein